MAVNLWADLLVLQARFDERKNVRTVGDPDPVESAESQVWLEAYELLTEVIKKHTR